MLALASTWSAGAPEAARTHDDHPHANPTEGTAGAEMAAAAAPCVGGLAGTFRCANVDLLAALPLTSLGETSSGRANDVSGWTDSQTGREYAIIGLSNGTSFVDITVPDNPVFLGRLPTHTVNSLWRDMEVHADHVFIVSEASGHGMQVFDLAELLDMSVAYRRSLVEFEP